VGACAAMGAGANAIVARTASVKSCAANVPQSLVVGFDRLFLAFMGVLSMSWVDRLDTG